MNINQLLAIQNRQIKKDWNNEKFRSLMWISEYANTIKKVFEKLEKKSEWIYVHNHKQSLVIEFSQRGMRGRAENEKIEFAIRTKDTKKGHWRHLRVYEIAFKSPADKSVMGKMTPEQVVNVMRERFHRRNDQVMIERDRKIADIREELDKFGMTWKDYKHLQTVVNRLDNGYYDGKELK